MKPAHVIRKKDNIVFDAAVLKKDIPYDEFLQNTSHLLRGKAKFKSWLNRLIDRTKFSIEIQSDVATRDGVGVVIKRNEAEILEIFRDDSDRIRYVTVYSEEIPLPSLEKAIDTFNNKYYEFIDYDELNESIFDYTRDFIGAIPWEVPLLEYYREYSSVWVILNPFYKLAKQFDPTNEMHNRFAGEVNNKSYPTEEFIVQGCDTITWEFVLKNSALKTLDEIDTALTGIKVEDDTVTRLQDELARFCDQNGLFYPVEQAICPKTVERIRNALVVTDHKEIKLKDQFNEIAVEISKTINFPYSFIPFAIDADSLTTLCSATFDDSKLVLCSKLDAEIMQNTFKKFKIEFVVPKEDSSLQNLLL